MKQNIENILMVEDLSPKKAFLILPLASSIFAGSPLAEMYSIPAMISMMTANKPPRAMPKLKKYTIICAAVAPVGIPDITELSAAKTEGEITNPVNNKKIIDFVFFIYLPWASMVIKDLGFTPPEGLKMSEYFLMSSQVPSILDKSK